MNAQHIASQLIRATWVFVFLVTVTDRVTANTLVDDFNDCIADGWTPTPAIGPGGTTDASFMNGQSCAYRLENLPTGANPPFSGIGASWDASVDSKYSDGFFRATVHPETQETAVVMAMRAVPLGDGYLGELHLDRGVMLIRNHGIDGAWFEKDLDVRANEDWHMQIGTVGDQFSLKAWRVGDPEPSSPQLTATYTTRSTGRFSLLTGVPPPGGPGKIGSTVFEDVHFFPAGDFDRNGDLDVVDINTLTSEISMGTNDVHFDLTGDNLVNRDDHTDWVKVFKKTWFGDANLDGEFDSTDLIDVFQVGAFEQEMAVGWNGGDWTGDHRFDTTDLVAAFQDGGYAIGPQEAVNAVPEPSCICLPAVPMVAMYLRRRRPLDTVRRLDRSGPRCK